jgi:hypothetical protein
MRLLFSRMNLLVVALTLAPISFKAIAHEGHSDAPGSVAPPHGGKIMGASGLYLEFVRSGDDITIYAFDHDLKPIPVADLTLTLLLELPRKKEKAPLTATSQSDSWQVKVDGKNARRYTVLAGFKWKDKTGNLKFTVEK